MMAIFALIIHAELREYLLKRKVLRAIKKSRQDLLKNHKSEMLSTEDAFEEITKMSDEFMSLITSLYRLDDEIVKLSKRYSFRKDEVTLIYQDLRPYHIFVRRKDINLGLSNTRKFLKKYSNKNFREIFAHTEQEILKAKQDILRARDLFDKIMVYCYEFVGLDCQKST